MYLRLGEADLASHIVHLHLAVRLNDPAEIVLEHVAVEGGQVLRHDHVILQLNLVYRISNVPLSKPFTMYLVCFDSLLEVSKAASLRSKSHCFHRLHVWTRVPANDILKLLFMEHLVPNTSRRAFLTPGWSPRQAG